MASAAFRSSTRRSSGIGAAEPPRRARSLSRYSGRCPLERSEEVARGRFVNTERGSRFPEVSLEELASEFASGMARGMVEDEEEEEEERGRTRRVSDAGFAMETESSRRRGRSVSRKAGGGQGKGLGDSGGGRRMRSLSVARYRSHDFEGEMDLCHSLSNRSKSRNVGTTTCRQPSSLKSNASTPSLSRNSSKQDLQLSHDSCSSQSSSITDDEGRGDHSNGSGFSKKTRAANGPKQKLDKPIPMLLSEADDFQMASCDATKTIAEIRRNYIRRLEESEKRKQELLAELAAEERRGQQLSKIVQGLLPEANQSMKEEKQSRGWRRSNEKTRMSRQLTEEAEKYFEEFILNIEDTDLSSFDGERSDTSSTIGGSATHSDAPVHTALSETQEHLLNGVPSPVESDGVLLPWLQWGTADDSSLLPKDKTDSASTATNNLQNAVQEASPCHDRSHLLASSRGSCSSPDFGVGSVASKAKQVSGLPQITDYVEKFGQTRGMIPSSRMDGCLNLQKNEETLFEAYRQRQRVDSGGLLLCSASFCRPYVL